MFFKKKINTTINSDTEEIEAIQLWYVEWVSRYGAYYSDTTKETEAFTSNSDAKRFKNDLEKAFKILRHTSDINVTCSKRN